MRVIALMNQKGGVGKTTTTASLGAALVELGKRVLLIDLDPQAHLTINYGVETQPPEGEEGGAAAPTLYDVLVDNRSLLEATIIVDSTLKGGGSIGLVPSDTDLAAAEVELASELGREIILRKRLEAVQEGGADFDYVLMDCPPSLGILTVNALSAADEVIIPMQPHFLALQGVGKLLETVQIVKKRTNPKLRVSGIVLTMWDGQARLSTEVVTDLQRFIDEAKGQNPPLPWSDARIFDTKIRRNIKLAECPSFGKSILAYEPTSNGAADYRGLAKEVLAMEKAAKPEVTVSVSGGAGGARKKAAGV
jgi:chromosome partitioning protein